MDCFKEEKRKKQQHKTALLFLRADICLFVGFLSFVVVGFFVCLFVFNEDKRCLVYIN